MNRSNSKIVKSYCWTAAGIGVVPLVPLWVAGYAHLVKGYGQDFIDQDIKGSIGTIIAALGAWFVSGRVAGYVTAGLAAAGLTMAGVTGFASFLLAGAAMLGLKATINALFTFRFLRAGASLVEDSDASHPIFIKA